MSNSKGHNVLFNLEVFIHKVTPTQKQHLHTAQASFGIYSMSKAQPWLNLSPHPPTSTEKKSLRLTFWD